MSSARNEARRGLRGGLFLLAIAVAGLAATSNEADARRHRHSDEAASPPSSSIVVDGNSNAVLESAAADELGPAADQTVVTRASVPAVVRLSANASNVPAVFDFRVDIVQSV